jgi:glycosyltransferase involved in cell wall biosynthesis
MDLQTARTLVVVPCFNEAGSVLAVVRELKGADMPLDVLVVDDGSTDDTGVLASRVANTLRLPVNLGIGGAVQAGILYAERGGYDFAWFDGDGQHRADQVAGAFCRAADHRQPRHRLRFLAAGGFRSSGHAGSASR